MFATNPQFNLFKFAFPSDFFKSGITQKYDEWLKVEPLNIDKIEQAINQSIQTITLPSFGLEPTMQLQPHSGGGVEVGSTTVQPWEKLVEDKNFTVTMKHVNGFMTYFLMLEHYIQYADSKNGKVTDFGKVPDMSVVVYDNFKNVLFTFTFTGVQFIGLDELELSKTRIHNEFTTFGVRFMFNSYRLDFHTPERKVIHD